MHIQFYAKNLELNSTIKDYINEKIGGLARFENSIIECRVDLSKNMHHQKGNIYRFEVNLKLSYYKKLIRSVVIAENMMSAIDQVKDKLQRQITKVKSKFKKR